MEKAIATAPGRTTIYKSLTVGQTQQRQDEEAAEAIRKADYEVNERYKDDRKAEYPPIGDQLDAIWKELKKQKTGGAVLEASADAMLTTIDTVKLKYPKA